MKKVQISIEIYESTLDKINSLVKYLNTPNKAETFKKIVDIAYFIVKSVVDGKKIAIVNEDNTVKIFTVKDIKKDL